MFHLIPETVSKKAVPTKRRRRNLVILFNNTTITPFKWRGKYLCFYCGQDISDHTELIKHTKSHGECDIKDFGIQSVRTGDFEVKLDVSEVVCEICSEAFVSLEEITMHLMGKHKLGYDKDVDVHLTEYRLVDLTCLVCGESFEFFKHLVQHMNASHPKEVLVCEVCSQRFSKKRDLEAHTRNYHSKDGYKCDECDNEFASKTKLRAHKESQHLQTCNVCFEKFRSSALKMKHINSVHLNKETLKCGFCRKVWKTKHAFLQHSSKCRIRKQVKQINDDKPQNTDIDDSDERQPIVRVLRNNLACIFNMSTAIPFKFFMNRFRCFYCPKDFIEHEDLKQHSVLEHPVCDIKHRSMRLRARDNVDIKIDISTLQCKVCYQNIPDLNTLIDHLIVEHKADYNKTVDCRILTFNLVKDSYLCPLCPDSENYRFFGNLLKHMNGTHSNNKLICVFCGKAFRTDPNLRSHISRHHKAATFKCTECESVFHTGVRLNSHMAKAHGKKVAKCPKCPERFVSTYLRQKHLITAHNFGATCPHCGRMFTRNSLMRDHIRRTHLKEKKVECPVCNMRFFDAFMLRMHMVRHDGDRNFQCDLCGKKFLWKKNLRNHMTTHEKHALTHMTDIHM